MVCVYGPADTTAAPSSLASLIIQTGLTFSGAAYPGCPGKEAVKRMFVCLSVNCQGHRTDAVHIACK